VTAFILGALVKTSSGGNDPLLVVVCVACWIMCHMLDDEPRRRNGLLGCAGLCAVATPTRGAEWLLASVLEDSVLAQQSRRGVFVFTGVCVEPGCLQLVSW
jgi:hypothetical protein